MNDIVVNENVLLEDGSLNASAVESFRIWKLLFGLGEDYVFDGNGKFISGLYLIDYGSGLGVGGLLGENYGIIKNLTVKNSYLEGYEFSSIVYYNGGIVENCHSVNNTLVSKYGGGGVVGINYGNGTIKDCTNSSNLYVENGLDDEAYEISLGGIVGISDENGTIQDCINSSNLYVENGLDDETIEFSLGGIVAKNEGEVIIKNCVNYGTITATANSSEYINVGGIIGTNNSDGLVEITNCHNKGNIIVQSIASAVGGVIGFGVYNRISDCTNTGNITVDANLDEAVGGIVGVSDTSTIERCYNAGDIEINAGSIGYSVAGIAGWTIYTTIVNSYNVGNIEVTFDENFDENNAERMATSGIANIDTSLVGNCYNAGEIIIPAEYQSTPIYGGVIVLDDNDTSSLVENNYYLNATANEYGGRTAEQFASGEVAYALCKQIVIDEEFTIDGSAWGQTIGTDLTPVFDGDKVYAISHCANNATLYANDQSAVYILTKTDAKESTCQVQGNNAYWTCSICNKVYADENCTIVTSVEDSKLDLADHDWSATWDYEDEDGHAHKCLTPGCNEISTLEDHVEGAPATEDDPQLCTECGYVITPATGHVNHVSSGEYGYDENSHWFKCTGCDTYKIDQTAHQFDNACDTTCECGYVRTVTHQYTVLNKDDTHHWYECSVCNEVEQGSKVAHSGGSATCEDKAVCSICSTEYGNLGSHNYDRSEWGYIAEDGHGYVCVWCEEVEEVIAHTPNIPSATEEEAKTCTECGYVIEDRLPHVHNPASEWTYDTTHHWKECIGCDGQEFDKATHTFDNCEDTTCECGYVREALTHVYDNCEDTTCANCTVTREALTHVYDDCEDTTCANCTVTREPVDHNYVDGVCTECGDEEEDLTIKASISFADVANRTEITTEIQVWVQNGITVTNARESSTSPVADYSNPVRFYKSTSIKVEHPAITKIVFNCNTDSYATALDNSIEDDENYTVTVDGKVVTVEFTNAVNAFKVARLSGQVRMDGIDVVALPVVHEHDFTGAWQYDADGHWHVCTDATCDATDTKANHTYDNACDTTCECGYVRTVGNHVYDNACDTTCNECNAVREVAGHVYDNCEDTACNECNAVREALTHVYDNCEDTTCANCTVTREPVDHNYVDGVCTECGAQQPSDPDQPGEPEDPTDPDQPGEPEDPSDPDQPGEPEDPTEPDVPNQPTDPSEPTPQPPVDGTEISDGNDGLSTGAIVGIAVAAAAVVAGGFAIFWLVIRKRRR